MQVEELIRAGKLDDALRAAQERVRENASDPKLRVMLFQLLSVLGRWDKAMTQLNVAGEMDPKNLLMAQVCRAALSCEVFRGEVFAGKRTPLVFGQPAEWVTWLIQATHLTAAGQHARAAEMRDRAFEAAPSIPGDIDGQPFEWIADADQRLGPILEAVVDGRYFWIPLANIHRITMEKPADLRDLVWTPAQFVWSNGGSAVGLIPTRYPGSELASDPAIAMARKTEWQDLGTGESTITIGLGQRLFATDKAEYPILESRQITIGEPPPEMLSERDAQDEPQLEVRGG